MRQSERCALASESQDAARDLGRSGCDAVPVRGLLPRGAEAAVPTRLSGLGVRGERAAGERRSRAPCSQP